MNSQQGVEQAHRSLGDGFVHLSRTQCAKIAPALRIFAYVDDKPNCVGRAFHKAIRLDLGCVWQLGGQGHLDEIEARRQFSR